VPKVVLNPSHVYSFHFYYISTHFYGVVRDAYNHLLEGVGNKVEEAREDKTSKKWSITSRPTLLAKFLESRCPPIDISSDNSGDEAPEGANRKSPIDISSDEDKTPTGSKR